MLLYFHHEVKRCVVLKQLFLQVVFKLYFPLFTVVALKDVCNRLFLLRVGKVTSQESFYLHDGGWEANRLAFLQYIFERVIWLSYVYQS